MASEFFGRQRECRFSTAGCGNKMAVSVTGPRAVNGLGGPVIPGSDEGSDPTLSKIHLINIALNCPNNGTQNRPKTHVY